MKKLKNEKGITLVSLVITIIVLIILAAVSINLTIGSDGIITRAKEAAENMEVAALEEQEMLNTLYGQLDGSVENGGISYDKIAQLKEQYDNLSAEYTDFKMQIATAITNKGIETDSGATAEIMVNNIEKISEGNVNMNVTLLNKNSAARQSDGTIQINIGQITQNKKYIAIISQYGNGVDTSIDTSVSNNIFLNEKSNYTNWGRTIEMSVLIFEASENTTLTATSYASSTDSLWGAAITMLIEIE